MANTVEVKNINAATSDKEVKDFFSFCGKITTIDVTSAGDTKSATVIFEKETAAKTALLLNNTQLGPNHISVTGAASDEDAAHHAEKDSDEITQEEKPRARIFAEYLAHGYVVGDVALQRAIELDHKHGVSSRFLTTLHSLDQKYHATNRAKTADQSYGITKRATNLLTGLHTYFERAINTPTGKKVVDFYTLGQHQVADIHSEARRLADLKKEEHGGSAYKAAGLEKVFGPEKTTPDSAPGAAATSTTSPPAPAEGGAPAAPPA